MIVADLDLDAIEAAHREEHDSLGDVLEGWCGSCGKDWPCPTAALVAEVRLLRNRLTELEGEPRHPTIRNLTAEQCSCPNQHPHLDEFVMSNVTVHFEQMGDAQFWIGINDYRTQRMWHINCGAVNTRVKGYAFCEDQSAIYGGVPVGEGEPSNG